MLSYIIARLPCCIIVIRHCGIGASLQQYITAIPFYCLAASLHDCIIVLLLYYDVALLHHYEIASIHYYHIVSLPFCIIALPLQRIDTSLPCCIIALPPQIKSLFFSNPCVSFQVTIYVIVCHLVTPSNLFQYQIVRPNFAPVITSWLRYGKINRKISAITSGEA